MKIMITDELLMSADPHKLAGLIEAITGTKEDTSLRARLRDAKIDRGATDASTDVNLFIRSQTDVKRRAFDKGAQARGGVITGKDTIV
jgi:hypothetical protein